MKSKFIIITLSILVSSLYGQANLESDVFEIGDKELELFFVGHGTLMFQYDYTTMPDADLVLITHQHGDHLDASAIDEIVKEGTVTIMTQTCVDLLIDHPEIEVRVRKLN